MKKTDYVAEVFLSIYKLSTTEGIERAKDSPSEKRLQLLD